ncbi:polyketide synthase [Colletotrichum incanum]|uniref:Polyketide synthase n=1 Tax=Colletotrichum incanum TaxID=1573173 RepID=A0A167BCW9_COLIC|nr:polyketide synthase [Colletotrichum incanum]OHW95275.1 polyketide synthase [Colletotrichum incanum]
MHYSSTLASFQQAGRVYSEEDGEKDPIVICGMAARLPGGVSNTQDFWNLLVDGKSGLAPISGDRWQLEGFYSSTTRGGTIQNQECYLLNHIDLTRFDASHFTCGRKEIESMDPMQRQLLEITRECLDNAGETGWAGRRIGCFVGSFTSDWQDDLSMDPHHTGLYRGSGHLDFLQPNRISYEYGWTGPSMLIRTGCSSSLVALHQAAEAVRHGACTSAMALGVNLITSPGMSVNFTNAGLLSPSGKCKTFDLLADGYGRGEAVNAVYVKRLSDALRDRSVVHAIIRASGTNNDGRAKGGIMCPDAGAQETLIRETYARAGISDADYSKTAFFECHGTGTATGDPLEVAAVANIWKEHGGILIGAVKPNVGHSEGAAGLTSVIKAVLALKHKIIPPNIYLDTLNPKIPWKAANLRVPMKPTPWPQDRAERVSVNSFGVSGSNAHVSIKPILLCNPVDMLIITVPCSQMVLESYQSWLEQQGKNAADYTAPDYPLDFESVRVSSDSVLGVSLSLENNSNSRNNAPLCAVEGQPRLLLFSATHVESLKRGIDQHREYLDSGRPSVGRSSLLENLAYTLAHHREHLNCRGYAIADDKGAFDVSSFRRLHHNYKTSVKHRTVFVYTGQGVQWAGMGQALLKQNMKDGRYYGVFADSIRKLDRWLQAVPAPYRPDWTIEQELLKDTASSLVAKRGYSQPCATAVQIALTDLLASLGISPDAVVAHSLGEAAAAYASGALSAGAAIAVAFFRGWLLARHHHDKCPATTCDENHKDNNSSRKQIMSPMAVISLDSHELTPFLLPGVVVACENSHKSTTISGDPAAIQHCIDQAQRRHPDVKATMLEVDTAYHSPTLGPLAKAYQKLLEGVLGHNPLDMPRAPLIPHFSSVTGAVITGNEFGPRYWRDSFLHPVLFSQAMKAVMTSSLSSSSGHETATATITTDQQSTLLIEVGAHPALRHPIQENLQRHARPLSAAPQQQYDYMSTLRRGEDSEVSLLRLVGEFFNRGLAVDLAPILPAAVEAGVRSPSLLSDLPTYAWHYDASYSNEPRNASRFKHKRFVRHELLGDRVLEGNDLEPTWRNMLDTGEMPWLQDHIVDKGVLFPAAGFVAIAGCAVRQVTTSIKRGTSTPGYMVRDMSITAALPLALDVKTEMMTRLIMGGDGDKDSDGHIWHEFRIMSCSANGKHWTSHARGFVRPADEEDATAAPITTAQRPSCFSSLPRKVASQNWYNAVKESISIEWGPAFQLMENITADPLRKEAAATVYDCEDYDGTQYVAHPTLIDQLLQINLVAITNGLTRELDRTLLPTTIGRLCVLGEQDLRMHIFGSVGESRKDVTPHDSKSTAKAVIFANHDDGGARPTAFVDQLGFTVLPISRPEDVPIGSYFAWDKDVTMLDMDEGFSNTDLNGHVDVGVGDGVNDVTGMNQDLTCSSSSPSNAQKPRAVSTYVHWLLGLLGWKMPDCRILEIGLGDDAVTRTHLDAINPGPLSRFYAQYLYACVGNESKLEHVRQAMEDLVSKASNDFYIGGVETISECGASTIDVALIAAEALLSDDHADDDLFLELMESLRDVMTTRGRLVVYTTIEEPGQTTNRAATLYRALEWLGQLGFVAQVQRPSEGVAMAKLASVPSSVQDAAVSTITDTVLLARDSLAGRKMAEQVKYYFEKKGCARVQVLEGQTTVPPAEHAGQVVISLLDLSHGKENDDYNVGTVYKLDQTTFRPFVNSLVGFTGSLIWAVPLAHTPNCSQPLAAMMQGTARTIRLEHRTDITMVEVDDESTAVAGALSSALWKISCGLGQRARTSLDPDYDYAVIKGSVQVPRMHWFSIPRQTMPGSVPTFRDDVSYLLVGGMGGLGRSVSTWMLSHGAKSLVFLSPSAGNERHEPFLKELEAFPGSLITTVSGDVSRQEDVQDAIEKAPRPIGGVMQLSLILRDNATKDMSFDEWHSVIKPRVDGTINLDRALFEKRCALDFFVIFGSGVCHTGFFGQANYGATNTFLNAFVSYRHKRGLPASIVDIGAVKDVGYVADRRDTVLQTFATAGFYLLREQEVLDSVALSIANSGAVCGTSPLTHFCVGGLSTKPLADPTNRVTWKRDVRFGAGHYLKSHRIVKSSDNNHTRQNSNGSGTTAGYSDAQGGAARFLKLAKSSDPSQLREPSNVAALASFIASGMSSLMLVVAEDISLSADLGSVGLDSIVAIELLDWLHQQLHVALGSAELLACASLMHLAEKIADELCKSL